MPQYDFNDFKYTLDDKPINSITWQDIYHYIDERYLFFYNHDKGIYNTFDDFRIYKMKNGILHLLNYPELLNVNDKILNISTAVRCKSPAIPTFPTKEDMILYIMKGYKRDVREDFVRHLWYYHNNIEYYIFIWVTSICQYMKKNIDYEFEAYYKTLNNLKRILLAFKPEDQNIVYSNAKHFLPWVDIDEYTYLVNLLTLNSIEALLEFIFIEMRFILSSYDFIVIYHEDM